MDPQTTLRMIRLAHDDADARAEACKNLARWIARGGFQPDWAVEPQATAMFIAWTLARVSAYALDGKPSNDETPQDDL